MANLSGDVGFVLFFFWPQHVACRILVPQPGIEPMPPAMEAWSPNHWTAREVPRCVLSVKYTPDFKDLVLKKGK